jgi:hypothetical protein
MMVVTAKRVVSLVHMVVVKGKNLRQNGFLLEIANPNQRRVTYHHERYVQMPDQVVMLSRQKLQYLVLSL